jgi:acetoacetyl-CoA synthetase
VIVIAEIVNLIVLISGQYTVNGKKIEIAVKQIVSGSNLKPSGTVANPESLNLYHKYRDIEGLVGMKAKAKAKL